MNEWRNSLKAFAFCNLNLLLKPKTWCKIKFLTKDVVLMVVCDMEYKFSDYIEKYNDFLKLIKKNK